MPVVSDEDRYGGKVVENFQDLNTSYSLSNVLIYIPSCRAGCDDCLLTAEDLVGKALNGALVVTVIIRFWFCPLPMLCK